MGDLNDRVTALERSNLRWRFLSVGLAFTALTAFVLAAQRREPRVLDVERILLRDSEGNIRATIGGTELQAGDVEAKKRFGLSLYDESGSEVGSLGIERNTAALFLKRSATDFEQDKEWALFKGSKLLGADERRETERLEAEAKAEIGSVRVSGRDLRVNSISPVTKKWRRVVFSDSDDKGVAVYQFPIPEPLLRDLRKQ